MSVIVAVQKDNQLVMASDSLTLFGETQRVPGANSTTSKARFIGDALVGAAGWGVYDHIIDDFLADEPTPDLSDASAIFRFFLELWKAMHDRYPFVNDQAAGKDTPFGDLDSSFLIGNSNGIFKVSPDMDVCAFNQYFAIGSGSEYALGALYTQYDSAEDAESLARSAVRCAIQFDVHCGGEIRVLQHSETWAPAPLR